MVQGAAVITVALNLLALWKQSARPPRAARVETHPRVPRCLAHIRSKGRTRWAFWW